MPHLATCFPFVKHTVWEQTKYAWHFGLVWTQKQVSNIKCLRRHFDMAQMEFENMNWNLNLAESSSLEDQAKWYLGVPSKDTKVRGGRKGTTLHELLCVQLQYVPELYTHSKSAYEGVGLWQLACWGCGFESYGGHGRLSVVSVVCCQVEVSATSWSLVQRSPTNSGASLCVI